MQKSVVVSIILLLLLGSISFNVKTVLAWYYTPVQTVTLSDYAKMGSTTQYGYIGPAADRKPQFYSAIVVKCLYTPGIGLTAFIEELKIEVSGKDPLGNPLPGDRFGGLSVFVSPDGSEGVQETLETIWGVLFSIVPYGLGEPVKKTISAVGGASTGQGSIKAWAQWQRPLLAEILEERGLRFGYYLVIDPTIGPEGKYTINIHYLAWICTIDSFAPSNPQYDRLDLYGTVIHEYVNTPNTPAQPSGPTSGYTYTSYTYSTSTTDPNGDSLRYEFSWGDGATTLTGWYTSGATASTSHTWSSSGTYYVKVRAQDSTGAWSEWSPSLTVTINSDGGGGGGGGRPPYEDR